MRPVRRLRSRTLVRLARKVNNSLRITLKKGNRKALEEIGVVSPNHDLGRREGASRLVRKAGVYSLLGHQFEKGMDLGVCPAIRLNGQRHHGHSFPHSEGSILVGFFLVGPLRRYAFLFPRAPLHVGLGTGVRHGHVSDNVLAGEVVGSVRSLTIHPGGGPGLDGGGDGALVAELGDGAHEAVMSPDLGSAEGITGQGMLCILMLTVSEGTLEILSTPAGRDSKSRWEAKTDASSVLPMGTSNCKFALAAVVEGRSSLAPQAEEARFVWLRQAIHDGVHLEVVIRIDEYVLKLENGHVGVLRDSVEVNDVIIISSPRKEEAVVIRDALRGVEVVFGLLKAANKAKVGYDLVTAGVPQRFQGLALPFTLHTIIILSLDLTD
jgi:hypothetical protein